jgi:hypothetical protein
MLRTIDIFSSRKLNLQKVKKKQKIYKPQF